MANPDSQAFEKSLIYPVLHLPAIDEGVVRRLAAEGFRLKDDPHITVANPAYLADLTAEQALRLSARLLAEPTLAYTVADVLWRITRPKVIGTETYERESLVALVDSTEITARLGEIATSLGVEPPDNFLHLTVATRPDTAVARRGISVNSAAAWAALGPELYVEGWLQKQ